VATKATVRAEGVRGKGGALAEAADADLFLLAMPDLIFVFDEQSRFQTIYAQDEALLAAPARVLRGRRIADFFPAVVVQAFDERIAIARAGNVPPPMEYDVDLGDGPRRFEGRFSHVGDGRVLVACRDMTEVRAEEARRREFTARLTEAQKLESLGVLAGGIAHDFNNLLTTIRSNTAAAAAAPGDQELVVAALDDIERASARAAELCRQMLVYGGRAPKGTLPIALTSVVEETRLLLEASLGKKVSFKVVSEKGPTILGDGAELRQLTMNLVTNASEALDERGGTVTIETGERTFTEEELATMYRSDETAPGPFATLIVRDDGPGMDAEVRRRIFEPFFSTKFAGRGLGLTAALGIVRRHHGAIHVESSPNEGTTVLVAIPANTERTTPVEVPPPITEPGQSQALVVLVVDDEPQVRRAAFRLLRQEGHEAIEAADGFEAERILRARADIDMVLLDLTMPVRSGVETFQALRAEEPSLPVVFSSGYAEEELRSRAPAEKTLNYLPKPYSRDELRAVLAWALTARRLRRRAT
jgi:signal transduction histidine kinase/ActR/RegA family two-component response regulator